MFNKTENQESLTKRAEKKSKIKTKKILGLNNEVSIISLGTWLFSGVPNGNKWGPTDGNEVYSTLEKALEQGINFFDGGNYGGGLGEEALGRLIKNCREKVVVTTKVCGDQLFPEQLPKAVDKILARFQSDYIDICYIHWPHPEIPLGRYLESMNILVKEGKLKTIGLSNFTPALINEAIKYSRISVYQPGYNFFFRYIEDDVVDICEKNNIALVPYSCLGRGLLTGKFSINSRFAKGDDRPGDLLFKEPTYSQCIHALEKVKKIVEKYNVSTTQVILRWTLNQPWITSALIGARKLSQLKDILGSLELELNESDMNELNGISQSVWEKVSKFGYDNLFMEEGPKKAEKLIGD